MQDLLNNGAQFIEDGSLALGAEVLPEGFGCDGHNKR
jgi:hypothetical protein